MNQVIQTILQRKSVRAYLNKPIIDGIKAQIVQAALRAPTAGNLMLYSIIEVADQSKKDALAKSCDNQPFIAKAPLVLLFLADYQRWYDYFLASGVDEECRQAKRPMRKPEEGDLMLACSDAVIAAQTAVIAAESFGIGSCYIGDIMENQEIHREMFTLPKYTFPICLLCFGYPTRGQQARKQTTRFDEEFIVFKDTHKRLQPSDFKRMFASPEQAVEQVCIPEDAGNKGRQIYRKKFNADFNIEMSRSVRAWIQCWTEDN